MRTTDTRSLTRIAVIASIALCACSPEAATASGSAAERTRSGEASEASPPFDGDTSPPFNGDISE